MKPRNFPARKLARQLFADPGLRGRACSARDIHEGDVDAGGAMTRARAVRTKKRRAG